MRAEANWQRGDEWDTGFDTRLLDDVIAELRTKIGKTTLVAVCAAAPRVSAATEAASGRRFPSRPCDATSVARYLNVRRTRRLRVAIHVADDQRVLQLRFVAVDRRRAVDGLGRDALSTFARNSFSCLRIVGDISGNASRIATSPCPIASANFSSGW